MRARNMGSTLLLLASLLMTVSAEVERATVLVAVQPPDGGVVEGAGTFTPGSSCTLRAVPNEGWRFVKWMGEPFDGSSQNPLIFFVSSDVELTAVFEPIPKPAGETTEVPSVLSPVIQAVRDHLLLFAGMLLLVAVAAYVWRRGRGEVWEGASHAIRRREAERKTVVKTDEAATIKLIEKEKPSVQEIGGDELQRLAANPDTWLGKRFMISPEQLAEASQIREVRLEGVERLLDLGILEWSDTGAGEMPLVGRGEDLERVFEAMSERPFYIFVYGSEGTGKSRIVREALEGAGVSYVSSELSTIDEQQPLDAALRNALVKGGVKVRGSTTDALLAGLFSLREKRCLLIEDCHLISSEEMARLARAVIDARVSTVLTGREGFELDGFKHFALRDHGQEELMWMALAYSAVHGRSLRSDAARSLVSCAVRNGQATALLTLMDEAFRRAARTAEDVTPIADEFMQQRVERVLGRMNPLMREFLNYVKSGGRRGVESNEAYEYYAQVARQVGYSGSRASFWKTSSDLSKLNLIHSKREGTETRYHYGAPDQAETADIHEHYSPLPPSVENETASTCICCGTRIPAESVYCPSCGRKVASTDR